MNKVFHIPIMKFINNKGKWGTNTCYNVYDSDNILSEKVEHKSHIYMKDTE